MEAVELVRGVRVPAVVVVVVVSMAFLARGLWIVWAAAWVAPSLVVATLGVVVAVAKDKDVGIVGDPAGKGMAVVVANGGFNGVAAESLSLFSLPGATMTIDESGYSEITADKLMVNSRRWDSPASVSNNMTRMVDGLTVAGSR